MEYFQNVLMARLTVCKCVCRYPVQYVPVSVCLTETTWSLLVKAIRWLESSNILWDAAHRGFEGWLTGWNPSFLLLATFTCEDYTTLAITREMWINLWPGFILVKWLLVGEKCDWSESFLVPTLGNTRSVQFSRSWSQQHLLINPMKLWNFLEISTTATRMALSRVHTSTNSPQASVISSQTW